MSAPPTADESVAAYLIHHPDLYGSFLHRMDIPFGEKATKGLFSIANQLWKKYSCFPTHQEMAEILHRHPVTSSKPELQKIYLDKAERIYDPNNYRDTTREVILGRIIDNYKVQLQEEVEGFDIQNIREKAYELAQQIEKLDSLFVGEKDDWIFPLSDESLANPVAFLEELLGPPLTTGLPGWDRWLYGGPRRSESMMIIGVTNHGKSAVLESMACDMVRSGLRVVRYILDSAEYDIYTKPWANFSGVGIEDDKIASEFSTRLQRNVKPEWRYNMVVRYWPRHSKSMDDIKRDLEALKKRLYHLDIRRGVDPSEAGKIDAVFIDSADCTVESNKSLTENWMRAASSYAKVDSIAKEFDVFAASPAQAKISGATSDIIDMTQVAESWGKNHPMTFSVGLCRNASELADGTARLYIAKAKRKKCHYLVPVYLNNDLMRLTERGEPYYAFAQAEASNNQPTNYKKHNKLKKEPQSLRKREYEGEDEVMPMKKQWKVPNFADDGEEGMFKKKRRAS